MCVKGLTTGKLSLDGIRWKFFIGEQANDIIWDKKSRWNFTTASCWKC